MSDKSDSSYKPISPNEIRDWTNLIESIPMEPHERKIYEEHIKAMKEFRVQKPIDPKNIPGAKHFTEDEECSLDEEEDPKLDENEEYEKDEKIKQREQAKQEFEEDEEFHAAQFRKYKDWETRKRLALENLEQPIELSSETMELLMYGTPIQLINKVPDPIINDLELIGVLALYLTPENIARDQLFIDNETPISLSMDINPLGRNVFEIVSGDESMTGFPITYKSIVYIKVHYNEDNRDFFLSIDISNPYTVGKLHLQDTMDDLCQFQLLSVDNINNNNQELIDINSPVLIKHMKTSFFVMSKVDITVMNICGEEKFALGSDEVEGNNILWKFIYGSFDDLEFDFDNFITDRWWEPQVSETVYIPPNTSTQDPFLSKPSTSREIFDSESLNVPFVHQQVRQIDSEPYDAQWVEVGPGLQKFMGPPGGANECVENPEELFTRIKNPSLEQIETDSQQIINYLESIRNQKFTTPRDIKTVEKPSKESNKKSCTDNTVDFMKTLNPNTKQNNDLVRDNKFAKESFMWPKAPELSSPNSKPVLDNPEKIINAIKKINLQNAEVSPDCEENNNQLKELFVWPTISDAKTSLLAKEIIERLKARMMNYDESEKCSPTKLSKDHENENEHLKPDNFASSDLTVSHLAVKELEKNNDEMCFLKSKSGSTNLPLDNTDNKEKVPLTDGFWDFFDSDNTHLYDQDDFDLSSNNSSVDKGEIDEEQEEDVQVGVSANSKIEEGQGDMSSQLANSDKNKK